MPFLDVTTPYAFNVRAVSSNPVPVNTSSYAVILVPVPGGQGDPGPPGAGFSVVGETPTGALNGVNTSFVVANDFVIGSVAVYLNGLREGFFTATPPRTIQLETAPVSTDSLSVDYER